MKEMAGSINVQAKTVLHIRIDQVEKLGAFRSRAGARRTGDAAGSVLAVFSIVVATFTPAKPNSGLSPSVRGYSGF
jgi:hypothetical protein